MDEARATVMFPSGRGGGWRRAIADGASAALLVGLVALVGWLAVSRRGNLAWDDASYVREGLRQARLVEERGVLALDGLMRVGPKPPMLVAWIEAAVLAVGRRNLGAILALSTAVPFGLMLASVAAMARRWGGPASAMAALLFVAASPLALSYGAKVMVETLMGLWVLWALAAAARTLERPSREHAVTLGLAVGASAMTKATVALILPAPACYFAIRFLRRPMGARERCGLLATMLIPMLLVAGPWYARNLDEAAAFAARGARYTTLAGTASLPTDQRLALLAGSLAGSCSLAALAIAASVRALGGPVRQDAAGPDARLEFARLTGLGLLGGGVALMVTPHFDARFLLPLWPSASVVAGVFVARGPRGAPTSRRLLAYAPLVLGVALSIRALIGEPRTVTYWGAREAIEQLVTRYGARNIGNIGDDRDWNVNKTGLINELRDSPSDCFVLHDLSKMAPDEWRGHLGRFDALFVLDRRAFAAGFLAGAPGLNRAYEGLDPGWFRDRFEPVELDATLPPMTVYVAREPTTAGAPGRSRSRR